ncbi:MAG: hypothetical protein KC547_12310 [Anaerolineae bacterium]|nr:hypothetical protein [Anaerolineae bacterium]
MSMIVIGQTQMKRTNQEVAQEIYAGLQSADRLDRILAIHILGDCGDDGALRRLRAHLAQLCAETEAVQQAIARLEQRLTTRQPVKT